MKKKLLFLLVFFVPWLLQAQLTINVVQPPAGMISKDQLWNLIITNNSNGTSEVVVLMNVKDAVTGQSVLSAGTRSLFLNKGVKVLNIQDIQPVQYNYGPSGFSGNFLPIGSYIVCYTVNRYFHEQFETLATECARINITPLSPPLLITPGNRSVLQTPAPQLSWLPPTPGEMFNDLSYELSVAEVQEGQSPNEAILYNTPVYTNAHVRTTFETYPSTYSTLQPGKTYAWQVTARNGDSYALATEVWTFRVAADSVKKETTQASYILLGRSTDGSGVHTIQDKELNIKYYSFDKSHEAIVRFFNKDKQVMLEVKRTLLYGDNFLSFKLSDSFHAGEIYRIELTDLQNNLYTTSFSIVNKTN
jgi:hypothetical protein